jgi:hypothetical protein
VAAAAARQALSEAEAVAVASRCAGMLGARNASSEKNSSVI